MPVVITQPWSDKRVGNRTAVLVKEVSGVANELAARAACGLDKGSPFPDDPAYVCDNWDVTPISIGFFRVTFSFTNGTGDSSNPLAGPTRLIWNPLLVSAIFDRDMDGNALVNGARDPYDPGVEDDVVDFEFAATRWEPTPFDPQKSLDYMNHVNSATFSIQGHQLLEGQCKCVFIGPISEYTMQAANIEVGYRFMLRKDGWDPRLPNTGFRAGQNVSGPRGGSGKVIPVEIFNKADGLNQITQPVRLDGTGRPINKDDLKDRYGLDFTGYASPPPGATVETVNDADGNPLATFLKYKMKKRANFTTLGL